MKTQDSPQPIQINGSENNKKDQQIQIDPKHLAKLYRKNQVIVYLKKGTSHSYEKQLYDIKQSFKMDNIDPESIKVRSCGNCDIPIFLLSAIGIDSVISGNGAQGGTGPKTTTHGENYSLNFLSQIPRAAWQNANHRQLPYEHCDKDLIKVAVLDTGIDTCLVHLDHLCQEHNVNPHLPCFSHIKSAGWNFVANNDNIWDDNPGKHGSLVTQFIINQFKENSLNRVQIMPLKTHDKKGSGDLFSIICAIFFAIAKGADIINASWGFYYYYAEEILKYLKQVITVDLQKHGILFVTAAGNKVPSDDAFALSVAGGRINPDDLRNLAIHRFYPAYLTKPENNVVTVTTTNTEHVSPTENHSNIFVDMGVLADKVTKTNMQFEVPFNLVNGSTAYVAGSSFATAIATGVLGANCDANLFSPGLTKAGFVNSLNNSRLLRTEPLLIPEMIRAGRCINK